MVSHGLKFVVLLFLMVNVIKCNDVHNEDDADEHDAASIPIRERRSELTTKKSFSDPDYCFGGHDTNEEEEGQTYSKRSLRSPNTTSFEEILISTTTSSPENTTVDLDIFSDEFKECPKILLEKGCYEVLPNGSAYIEIYSMLFNQSDFYPVPDIGIYICNSVIVVKQPPKFPLAFDILAMIGMIISMVCIILHVLMFIFIRSLRNLPGFCLVSLCISLLVTYTTMFLRDAAGKDDGCFLYMMTLMYFWLTAFFWMNVLSYDVWRALRLATAKLRVASHLSTRFATYSLYAWGGPVLIVITEVVIDSVGDIPLEYKLIPSPKNCWFQHRPALLWNFAVPMSTILLCNMVFFVWSFVMISSAAMKDAENRSVLAVRLCVFLKLFVIMGLTWILGIIAAMTEVMAFWYLFAIANCSQGILIFFSFSFGKKTKRAWKNYVNRRKISKSHTQVSVSGVCN